MGEKFEEEHVVGSGGAPDSVQSGCRTFQLYATGTVMVVNCLANRSDKLQQVHFRRRYKLCRKPLCFTTAVLGAWLWTSLCSCRGQAVLFVAQRLVRQWTHDMRLFLVAFGTCSHILHVKMEPRILKSIPSSSPAFRGMAKVCTVDASVTCNSGWCGHTHRLSNPVSKTTTTKQHPNNTQASQWHG